jgi:hypothetical protein
MLLPRGLFFLRGSTRSSVVVQPSTRAAVVVIQSCAVIVLSVMRTVMIKADDATVQAMT